MYVWHEILFNYHKEMEKCVTFCFEKFSNEIIKFVGEVRYVFILSVRVERWLPLDTIFVNFLRVFFSFLRSSLQSLIIEFKVKQESSQID